MKELTGLIKEVHEDSRRPQAKFSFRLIIQQGGGRISTRDLGTVSNGRPGRDDGRTLEESRFIQGDYLDVAIYLGNVRSGLDGHASEQQQQQQH